MHRNLRLFLLSLLILSFATFSEARVVSYAPYTNRISLPGYHLRTTRHFPLIEKESTFGNFGQVVLYDATGVDEPRVVFPQSGSTQLEFVALWESNSLLGPAADLPPMLLVGTSFQMATPPFPQFNFSRDGGLTWTDVGGPSGSPLTMSDVDFGGPGTQGLSAPVQIGTAEWPFVVATPAGIWAISSAGSGKQLAPNGYQLVGRNRQGSRFLVRGEGGLRIVNLDGSAVSIGTADQYADYTGWITDDGAIYLQMLRPEGRFLFYWKNGVGNFVAGPYDTSPPALNSQPLYGGNTMQFFAVPTSDFGGAWMTQRRDGYPTTLSRHSPVTGLTPMWSDVSGPQIEALHPGASGETVLIQVHRERNVSLTVPFVDPALAVWRVGQPAPKTYDELYLNEMWNKGFLHVDADAVESGAPFVFNSGSESDPGDIIVSPPPPAGGGGDVIQEWGVVRGSLKQRLILPGVARLEGAFDSSWRTDVVIYNPETAPQEVDVTFAALGETVQALSATKTKITLSAQEVRSIPDVLKSLFNIENGGGALYFDPASAVNVTARTYSRKGAGTFGFGMQAIDAMNAAGPRFAMTFAGAFPGENFRTNLLLTDTSGRGTQTALSAYGVSGSVGSSQVTWSAPGHGIAQYNGLNAPLGLLSQHAGGLVVKPTRGTAIATVVAIDNRTNDPTWFPPDLPSTPNMMRAIPVIGHLDGANNSRFRSDLYLYNPSDVPNTILLEAKQWDSSQIRNIPFTLLPKEARVVPDVLPTLFGMTGLARLRYRTTGVGEGIRVTSRTYTIEESGATYGSLIPPLNNFQIALPGDRLEILGISGGSAFRTNLGLVELSPATTFTQVDVRIYLIDAGRNAVDTFVVRVPIAGGMQINDIFAARGIPAPEAGMIVIDVLNGAGLIGAYATLTDNITNDSTFLGAQLGATPQ